MSVKRERAGRTSTIRRIDDKGKAIDAGNGALLRGLVQRGEFVPIIEFALRAMRVRIAETPQPPRHVAPRLVLPKIRTRITDLESAFLLLR